MSDYIYAMTDGEMVKIGFAGNPNRRRIDHQCARGKPVSIIHVVECERALEAERYAIQKLGGRTKSDGEWYYLTSEEAVALIEEAANNPISDQEMRRKYNQSDAQLRAIRKYDAEKRAKKPVGFRLDEDEMALLDAARGAKSRAQFALEATLRAARKK